MSLPLVVTPAQFIAEQWTLGETFCKIYTMVSVTGVLISSFTLAAIASYRFNAILHNSAHRTNLWHSILWCAIMWIAAICVALPSWLNAKLTDAHDSTIHCGEVWNNYVINVCYTWSLLILQFVAPVIIMGYCHARIRMRLNNRARIVFQRARCSLTARKLASIERRKHVHRVLVIMVMYYIISWLPWHTTYIIHEQSRLDLLEMLYIICHFLSMTSTGINPLLYALLNRDFRSHLIPFGSEHVSSYRDVQSH
jgi:hypothetical protein